MKYTVNKERLNKLISNETPGWMVQSDFYEASQGWLNKSALITIKILSTLRSQSMTPR